MSDDVLITPASRKVEFFDNGGNIDGKIELDSNGNLNITSTGSIAIGDITQDIHVGDGTQAVDLVFDFTSSIYSVANQDLTIGKGTLGGNDVTIDGASAVLFSLAGTEQARLTSTGLGIGVTAPTDELCVRGGIKIGEFNDDDGTGYAGTAAPNSANLGTGASDPQIRVSGRSTNNPGIIQMAHFDANNFFGGTTEFVLGRLQYAMNENSQEVTTVAEIRGITSKPNDPGHFDGALTFMTSQGDGSGANLTEKMILTADGNVGLGEMSPVFASGGGLHIYNSTQANVRLEDAEGEYFDVAMQNGDAYLINRVSDGIMSLRTNGTERLKIAAGGAITFNQEYTFPTSDGSANQVLQTDGNGALSFATVSDTNTFVIFGEESDQYVSSEAAAGNANGFFISYGNGGRNITNSSSGLDHGVVLPVACTLTRVDFNFGNVGSETNSSNQTITVFKNESASTTTMVYNASGSGGNVFQKSFTSLSGTGTSYSAGDRFNVRATGLSGYTDTQVGPTRMTAYFTVA